MRRLIDADSLMEAMYHRAFETDGDTMWQSGCWVRYRAIEQVVNEQPTVDAQPESCEYYALCRHGRDENELRVSLGLCEYCNGDLDGYVKPIEKNNHAFIRFGTNGWELSLKANGWHGSAKIRYCPMCGRDLYVK